MEMKEVPKAFGELPSSSKSNNKEKADKRGSAKNEVWMDVPSNNRTIKGLEVLTDLDKIYISQRLMPYQEYTQKYFSFHIKNKKGENVYLGLEKPSLFKYITPQAPYTINLVDKLGKSLVEFQSPWGSDCLACFTCCDTRIKVFAPPRTYIGQVVKIVSVKSWEFFVEDDRGKEVFYIEGPVFSFDMGEVDMKIWDMDDNRIGDITREFPVLLTFFTDSSYYTASFQSNLNPKLKILIIAGVILMCHNRM